MSTPDITQAFLKRHALVPLTAWVLCDYASLLRSNPRYSGVIGSQDGAEFAKGLQRAGYATDPSYADKLNKIINGPSLRMALVG